MVLVRKRADEKVSAPWYRRLITLRLVKCSGQAVGAPQCFLLRSIRPKRR
jgi:hypothetical protein